MKLVKIFGVVMAVHAAVFMFVFAIPGCRSTGKKSAIASAPVTGSDASPIGASDNLSPVSEPAPSSDLAAVRFSPTRPGSTAATTIETAPVETPSATYTVVKGDNLWSISKKHGVTVKQLTAANNMRADSTLKLGQKLTIPGKSGAAPSAATAPSAAKTVAPAASAPAASAAVTHVVKAGETLGAIAKKYQVKVGEIATANNIADPTKLRVGQSLKIPGWQAPAAKAGATAKPAPAISAPVTTPTPTPAAPAAPIFSSPLLESSPAPAASSPFMTPAPESADAPIIRVEESGAPKIE
ncbi:LysM peptidoglycan-binding domain-containing protein [Rariglobus hedericola]|uniref:LysM peptidoglycan-binding domain-containing protein n=1 Tax=Rariglobus hedericola TaxID=2597822 RepID=A0A556QEI1_9BACT|nr:LysM peptidoglycan-binding domain-containing protein [Rariglobus hedericola]TSJ75063.1 LysM peptidoglycan-binding domain-containing protein [Rariglobus hedericola]